MNLVTLLVAARLALSEKFDLTILHTNDVHSRYDQINLKGKDCNPEAEACYGGLARLKTKIDEYRRNYPNTLLFDAGDQFQGSMFYIYYRGNATLKAMNHLQYNISTLGNHEFDDGPMNLGRIVKDYKFPVVSSNIDIPDEYNDLRDKVVKSHVFDKYKLGVVGYIFPEAQIEANLKKVRTEDPIQAVQREVKKLNDQGIKRIIAVSHAGYLNDVKLAENVKGLSLIIGGHTHSYLGPTGSTFRGKRSEGDYPTEITNLDGKTTYIVQAHEWAYLMGHIDISYDEEGYLNKIRGQTILLNSTVPIDTATNAMVKDIRKESDKFMHTTIGNTNSTLFLDDCQLGECDLGSYIADAMLKYHPTSDFAIINTGAIQDSIRVGDITRGDVCSALPIETAMVQINQTGQQIRDLLQRAIRKIDKNGSEQIGVQVSGIQFTYNKEKIVGKVQVINQSTQTYKPIELSRNYTIATLSFVAIGGDNFVVPQLSGFEFLDSVETFVMKHIQSQGQLQLPTKNRMVKVDDLNSPIPALTLLKVNPLAKSKINTPRLTLSPTKANRKLPL